MDELIEQVAEALFEADRALATDWATASGVWRELAERDKEPFRRDAIAAIRAVRAYDLAAGPSEAEIDAAAKLMYRRLEEQAFASGAVPFFTEWEDAGEPIRIHYRVIADGFLRAAAVERARVAEGGSHE